MHVSVAEAKEWPDTGVLGVLQPEVGNDEGILETYQMAALANSYGVRLAPHVRIGPIAVRKATQVCAVIPNLLVQEYPGPDRITAGPRN